LSAQFAGGESALDHEPGFLQAARDTVYIGSSTAEADEEYARRPFVNSDEKVIADVAEFGWHVIKVPEDVEGPAFAFTIGLTKTFAHPEVIIFGLALSTMHGTLNNIGALVRAGKRFEPGDVTQELLKRYACEFVRVPRSAYPDFFGSACRFYGGDAFEALQCVWPDRGGRFPWDDAVDDAVRRCQPLLGSRGLTRP
jgi:hypothetical protein